MELVRSKLSFLLPICNDFTPHADTMASLQKFPKCKGKRKVMILISILKTKVEMEGEGCKEK
uniref:Uncharacterized protein n=1 Tax=Oryza brachyantha TaxID=4533 RepID=J3LTM1_ORYBR